MPKAASPLARVVRAAPGALGQMCFEAHARADWQSVLEIVRDELHELLARQVVGFVHGRIE
jgi:hypothetical protein